MGDAPMDGPKPMKKMAKPMKKMAKPGQSSEPMAELGANGAKKVMKKPARRSSVMAASPAMTLDTNPYADTTAAYGASDADAAAAAAATASPKKSPKPMKKMARRPSQLPGMAGGNALPLDLLEEAGDDAGTSKDSAPVTPISEANTASDSAAASGGGGGGNGRTKLASTRGRQASLSAHAMTVSGEMDEMARALAESAIDEEDEEEGNEVI
eukprot:SAG22_NODE_982_length_6164_cov_32.072218_2_plen_212_part_00